MEKVRFQNASVNIGWASRDRVLKTREVIIILPGSVLRNWVLFGASCLRGQ